MSTSRPAPIALDTRTALQYHALDGSTSASHCGREVRRRAHEDRGDENLAERHGDAPLVEAVEAPAQEVEQRAGVEERGDRRAERETPVAHDAHEHRG